MGKRADLPTHSSAARREVSPHHPPPRSLHSSLGSQTSPMSKKKQLRPWGMGVCRPGHQEQGEQTMASQSSPGSSSCKPPGPRHTGGHAGATVSRAFSCHFSGLGVLAWGLAMGWACLWTAPLGGKWAGNFPKENTENKFPTVQLTHDHQGP